MFKHRFNFWLSTAIVLTCIWLGVRTDGADLPRTYVAEYTPTTLTEFPSTLTVNTTATNYLWVDVRRHDVVALQLTGQLMATNPGAATLSVPIYRSIDGVTAETTQVNGILLTFTGVLERTAVTNITTGGFGYLRIGPSMVNTATNGAACTNLVAKIAGKPPWALTYPYAGP